MTPKVVRSRAARADLEEIWAYIAADSERRADAFIDRLSRTFEALARRPLIGRSREELRPDLRSFPVGAYLVLYRPATEGIEIVRVVHGARDYTRLL